MNYYSFHIGDYRSDTMHLSMLEHGAYRQLLDWLFLDEKPIPKDTEVIFRRLSARTEEEKQAIRVVLSEMLELTEKGYVQGRVRREIATYKARTEVSRAAGKLGGRPRKTDMVTPGLTEKTEKVAPGLSEITPPFSEITPPFSEITQGKANQEPITNNQEPKPEPEVIHTELDTPRAKGDQPEGACVEPIPIKNKTTDAGLCCKAIMKHGVQGCNPSHPTLLTLIEAGATETEFANAARDAVTRGHHSFAYVVGIVKRRREEAAKLVLHQGRLPNKQEALEEENRRVAAAWMPPEMREARNAH
jgi:uncharacterized protein YdaU (DUF1376 family)